MNRPRPKFRQAKEQIGNTEFKSSWWLEKLREHPVKSLLTASLITGGFLLLMLFARIGSLPDLDLSGATSTLLAVAAMGVVFNVFLGGSVLGFGLITRTIDPDLAWTRTGSSLLTMAAPGLVSIISMATIWSFKPDWQPDRWYLLVPVVVAVSTVTLRILLLRFDTTKAVPASRRIDFKWLFQAWFRLGSMSFVWLGIGALSFVTITGFARQVLNESHPGWLLMIQIVAWVTVCYAANIFIVAVPRKNLANLITFLALSSVVLLYAITQNWTATSVIVARILGLGEIAVGMALTPEGCETLNVTARGRTVCVIKSNASIGWACPFILQSRIGSPFFVEIAAFGEDGAWPTSDMKNRISGIAIAKSEVKSWPRITALPANRIETKSDLYTRIIALGSAPDADLSSRQTEWLREQCATQR